MTWPKNPRPARAIVKLRDEVDALFPNRAKASDGMLGDAAHATRDSDHNPWVTDAGVGVVTAVDITDDAERGIPEIADFLVRTLVANRDPRVKYIIHESKIWRSYDKPGIPAWTPAPYDGPNKHFTHVHVSVKPEKVHFDSVAPWGLAASFAAQTSTRLSRLRPRLRAAIIAVIDVTESPDAVTIPASRARARAAIASIRTGAKGLLAIANRLAPR